MSLIREIFQILGRGFILAVTLAAMAYLMDRSAHSRDGHVLASTTHDSSRPSTPNLIIEAVSEDSETGTAPGFPRDSDEIDGPYPISDAEKLQYEPVSDELPLLESRKRKNEELSGAEYPEGEEMHLAPDSGIVIQREDPSSDRPETAPIPIGE